MTKQADLLGKWKIQRTLMQKLYHSPHLCEIFHQKARGPRGLFDPYSSEWDQTTMEEKIAIIKELQAGGISIREIMEAAANSLSRRHGRPNPKTRWAARQEVLLTLNLYFLAGADVGF